MPPADLLVSLVRAGLTADTPLFRRSVEAFIAEERARQHHGLAARLAENLKTNGVEKRVEASRPSTETTGFLFEVNPRRD